jgi:hypothetical protein
MRKFLILSIVVLLAGCEAETPPPIPKFQIGETVRFKLTKTHAMVTELKCYGGSWRMCVYDVRVGANESRTDVSLFGSDGAIQNTPLSKIDFVREFELEKE